MLAWHPVSYLMGDLHRSGLFVQHIPHWLNYILDYIFLLFLDIFWFYSYSMYSVTHRYTRETTHILINSYSQMSSWHFPPPSAQQMSSHHLFVYVFTGSCCRYVMEHRCPLCVCLCVSVCLCYGLDAYLFIYIYIYISRIYWNCGFELKLQKVLHENIQTFTFVYGLWQAYCLKGGGWFVFSHLLIQFTKFFDTD